jgi:hypothetical protein
MICRAIQARAKRYLLKDAPREAWRIVFVERTAGETCVSIISQPNSRNA